MHVLLLPNYKKEKVYIVWAHHAQCVHLLQQGSPWLNISDLIVLAQFCHQPHGLHRVKFWLRKIWTPPKLNIRITDNTLGSWEWFFNSWWMTPILFIVWNSSGVNLTCNHSRSHRNSNTRYCELNTIIHQYWGCNNWVTYFNTLTDVLVNFSSSFTGAMANSNL